MTAKKMGILALVVLALPLSVLAQSHEFGLGVILGEPTGLSMKAWSGPDRAIDAAAAWAFADHSAINIHADYLFHSYRLFRVERGRMPVYYGLGVRVLFQDQPERQTRVGVRIPLGTEYLFSSATLGIFLEIVPILDLSPATNFDLSAAVGIRFYF